MIDDHESIWGLWNKTVNYLRRTLACPILLKFSPKRSGNFKNLLDLKDPVLAWTCASFAPPSTCRSPGLRWRSACFLLRLDHTPRVWCSRPHHDRLITQGLPSFQGSALIQGSNKGFSLTQLGPNELAHCWNPSRQAACSQGASMANLSNIGFHSQRNLQWLQGCQDSQPRAEDPGFRSDLHLEEIDKNPFSSTYWEQLRTATPTTKIDIYIYISTVLLPPPFLSQIFPQFPGSRTLASPSRLPPPKILEPTLTLWDFVPLRTPSSHWFGLHGWGFRFASGSKMQVNWNDPVPCWRNFWIL